MVMTITPEPGYKGWSQAMMGNWSRNRSQDVGLELESESEPGQTVVAHLWSPGAHVPVCLGFSQSGN